MNRQKRKRSFAGAAALLMVLLLLLSGIGVQNATGLTVEAQAADSGYETKSFSVDMKVKEDNSILVTETIAVDFQEPRHGLYRYIPKTGTAHYAVEGEPVAQSRKMKIDRIHVEGHAFETDTENGHTVIRIGSEDRTVTGRQTYKITYRCRIYDDKISAYDLFYFNVLPQNWENTIEKAWIQIRMPKDFDGKSLEVYSDTYGNSGLPDDVIVKVEGRTIYLVGTNLDPGRGITVLEFLPEGYFTGEMTNDWAYAAIFAVSILTALLSLVLWFLFGRDPQLVRTVEFTPPEGLTPAEVGFITDEAADRKDIVSMVFYFADRGYLEIREEGEQFLLQKKRDLPEDAKPFEVTLMNGLFPDGKQEVSFEALRETFYTSYEAAGEQLSFLYGKKGEKPLFHKSSGIARVITAFLMILPLTLGGILGNLFAMEPVSVLGCGMSVLLFFLYLAGMFLYDKRYGVSRRKYRIGNGLLMGAALLMLCGSSYLLSESAGVVAAATAAICSVVVYVCARQMSRRTQYGAELLGKALGFKYFIETAELQKLELLIKESPQYFYHILPYAYVFGLTDTWAKKFEQIAVEPPSWYDSSYGGSLFHTWVFVHAFRSCANAFDDNITVPAAETGGGSFGGGSFGGGGGFSGGGFGGGGGGSW